MSENGQGRMQGWATWAVWAAVTAYAVCFVWWNRAAPEVELVPWHGVQPRALSAVLFVLAAFLAGFLVTALLSAVAAAGRGVQVRALRRRVTGLEEEIARLRNLPIDEDLHAPPEPQPAPESETT